MNVKSNSVVCPWCKTYYETRISANCDNCGGSLPPPAGPERGDAPPAIPRYIPKQFKNKILFKTNYMLLFGALFAIANFPFMFKINGIDIFLIGVGLFFCWKGYDKAMRKITVLQSGQPAHGTITNVYVDKSTNVSGKNPTRIEYTFDVNGTTKTASISCWDITSIEHYKDEPIWVVYSQQNFENNSSIWPPIA